MAQLYCSNRLHTAMKQIISFDYPQQIDKFKSITSLKHLQTLLKNCIPTCLSKCCYYTRVHSNRIFARCNHRNCKAIIRYKLDQQNDCYKLLTWNTHHLHDIKNKNKYLKIRSYIQNLMDLKWGWKEISHEVCDKFRNVGREQVYALMEKIDVKNNLGRKRSNQSQKGNNKYDAYESNLKLLRRLKELHQNVITHPQEKQLSRQANFNYIIITSDDRVAIPHQHSKIVYFVLDQSAQCQGYLICLFYSYMFGLQFKLHMTVLLDELNVANVITILRQFMKMTEMKPRVMFITQHLVVQRAVKQLKLKGQFHGDYFYEWNSVLNNLIRNGLHFRRKNLMKQLIIEPQNYIFQSKIQSLINEQSDDFGQNNELLQQFVKNADKCCYSQMHFQNIGLIYSYDRYTVNSVSILNKIYKISPMEQLSQKIIKLLLSIEHLQNHHNHKETNCMDEIYIKLNLVKIKFNVKLQININFIHFVIKSFQLSLEKLNNNLYRVFQLWHNCYYIVRKIKDKWSCECEYSNKSGLPCHHEIKVCLVGGRNNRTGADCLQKQVQLLWIKKKELRGNRYKGMASLPCRTIGDIIPQV